jgi:hypothetical protein
MFLAGATGAPAENALKRIIVRFACPDTDNLIDARDEDLAIADLSGSGIAGDRFNHRFRHLIAHCDFDLDLRQEIHRVLRAAVDLRMPLLSPVTLDFAHRHSLYAKRRQRFSHLIKLEWLDDRRDKFHLCPLLALIRSVA